jgi:phosphoribosyl-AMP cyclohydrolase
MRFRLRARLRRIASGLMLLAVMAFVQQGAMIAASQALASVGSMSDPAVTLSGPVHYHDSLARHVHVHGSTSGHVHKTADIDHDSDEGSPPFWSLGGVSAVIPALVISAVSFEIVRADERPHVRLEGIKPDGLNRPPSTPSIT